MKLGNKLLVPNIENFNPSSTLRRVFPHLKTTAGYGSRWLKAYVHTPISHSLKYRCNCTRIQTIDFYDISFYYAILGSSNREHWVKGVFRQVLLNVSLKLYRIGWFFPPHKIWLYTKFSLKISAIFPKKFENKCTSFHTRSSVINNNAVWRLMVLLIFKKILKSHSTLKKLKQKMMDHRSELHNFKTFLVLIYISNT